jgi:NDP-sugar pyrophosphorylase family protein
MNDDAINKNEMIVLLLAGGEGQRLLGSEYPKALMRFAIKPVIEILIDKILTVNNQSRIYVVTRNKWKGDFDRWQEGHKRRQKDSVDNTTRRGDNEVKILYEEELSKALYPNCKGTAIAIYKTLCYLIEKKIINESSSFFVFNADNYFDDPLNSFFTISEKCLNDKCICVNAIYDLQDYNDAKRFGVVRVDSNTNDIINFKQKPESPKPNDTLISTGCYGFHYNAYSLLEKLLTAECHGNVNNKEIDISSLLIELTRQKKVKGVKFEDNWFDIGTKNDLSKALTSYISKYFDKIETLGDLEKYSHQDVADRYFIAAQPNQITFDKNKITFNFNSTDLVLDKKNIAPNHVWASILFDLIVKSNVTHQWPPAGILPNERIFLSGGSVLIDTKDANDYFTGNESRLILQRRDFGAFVDPDRFTMSAGQLDTLNLTECCYSELQEEVIIYGVNPFGLNRVLFYLKTPKYPLKQHDLIKHILKKKIDIPGIDSVVLPIALQDDNILKQILITIDIREFNIQSYSQNSNIWEVVINLDGKEKDQGWFFVTFDPKVNTLEFRKIVWADLSGIKNNEDGQKIGNFYGNLAGIADGEGYGRIPIMVGLDELSNYLRQLGNKTKDELIDGMMYRPENMLKLLCSGVPGNGRFNRFYKDIIKGKGKEFLIPIALTTHTVGHIFKFLSDISK